MTTDIQPGDRLIYRPVTGGEYCGTCVDLTQKRIGIQIDGRPWYVRTVPARVERLAAPVPEKNS